ncbi:MAG: hypothetical protein Q8P10_02390 [bacterium]|nr:hypothetical protein [bacterium]
MKIHLKLAAKWDIFCYSLEVYYVYILQLKDKTYHHGSAADLKQRLSNHKSGVVIYPSHLKMLRV